MCLCLFASAVSHAAAAQLSLEWDPPQERLDGSPFTDLAGYRVFYGTTPGVYTETVYIPASSEARIEQLVEGRTYYFAVAALDSSGRASPLSEEFAWNSLDEDVDLLPDAWETAVFGETTRSSGTVRDDADGDGLSDMAEYIAGTDPRSGDSTARLQIRHENGRVVIEFPTRRAEGPGYEGRTRIYRVERSVDGARSWSTVPGLDRIAGRDEIVAADLAADDVGFLRLSYWLD